MEGVIDNSFESGYVETTNNLYDELKSRTDNVILNSMKGFLREKGVQFDGSTVDLETFKETVIPGLDDTSRLQLANLEKNLNTELESVIEDLKAGSKSRFSKFMDGFTNVGKSTTEMVARATAIKAAYVLSPGAGFAATVAATAVPAAVRAGKEVIRNSDEGVRTSLDVMLMRLMTTQTENGPKFELDQDIINRVSNELKMSGNDISKENPAMFLRDVTRLDNATKKRAVNIINNMRGNIYDVDSELRKVEVNLKTIRKSVEKNVVAPISTAAMVGMTTAGFLNDVAPEAAPAIITACMTGAATGNLALAMGAAGSQYTASKFAGSVPVVGDLLDDALTKVNSLETTAATTGVAVAATIGLRVIPSLAMLAGKKIVGKFKRDKEVGKGMTLLDKEVAAKEKMSKAQADLDEEMNSRTDKDVMLDIVRDVLLEKGVRLPNNVKSAEELRDYVRGLGDDDKKQVYKVASLLESVKEDSNKSLKKTLTNVAKTAYWGGVIALAGLGVYDMFINPGFLEGLKEGRELSAEYVKAGFGRDDITAEKMELVVDSDGNISAQEIAENFEAKELTEAQIREYMRQSGLSREDLSHVSFDTDGVMHITEELNKEDVAELIVGQKRAAAYKEFEASVNEIREFFPETPDENISTDVSFWTGAGINNRDIVDGLDLNTEEGMLEFLRDVDPNSEDLQYLFAKTNTSTIEELVKSPSFKETINVYENLDEQIYVVKPSEYLGYLTVNKHEAANRFGNIVDERFNSTLGTIPTKSASDDRIVQYMLDMCEDPTKKEYYEIYLRTMERKGTNDIIESFNDSKEVWQEFFEKEAVERAFANDDVAKRVALEAIEQKHEKQSVLDEVAKEAIEAQKKLEEAEKSADGFKDGINTKLPFEANANNVFAAGAAVGATAGIANETVKRKGLFNRIKGFFIDRFGKKNKALPEGSGVSYGVEMNNDGLKGIEVKNPDDIKYRPENSVKSDKDVSKGMDR